MADLTLNVNVKIKWWFKVYLELLAFFCAVTGKQPDVDKLVVVIKRGMKVTFNVAS